MNISLNVSDGTNPSILATHSLIAFSQVKFMEFFNDVVIWAAASDCAITLDKQARVCGELQIVIIFIA